MTTPSRAVPALRQIPREFAYHVELTPAEVLARVETDPDVQRIAGFPARGRSDRKFLVERAGRGFRNAFLNLRGWKLLLLPGLPLLASPAGVELVLSLLSEPVLLRRPATLLHSPRRAARAALDVWRLVRLLAGG